MSGITSGIGLISGINTAELINQLMAIEARPVQNLQARVKQIDAVRTAFLGLSAQLLAMRNTVSNFHQASFFKRFGATSSNEDVIMANASEDAQPGTATLRVHSLVTSHALVTRGFADPNQTPLGVGTITIESAAARVDRPTELSVLNGGRGVRRGVIRITDRSGATADIDLGRAFTVEDVLEAINTNTGIRVRAGVTGVAANGAAGDRLFLEDFTGGAGNLVVSDLNGGSTAQDLGIAANVAASRLDGGDLLRLDMSTTLASLNDGNGIDRLRQGATADDLIFATNAGTFGASLGDVLQLDTDLRAVNSGNGVRLGVIRITDRSGKSAEIDLSAAQTVGDVRNAIHAAGLAVSATTVNSRLQITDTAVTGTTTAAKLKIEDVSGFAAQDLGIAGEVDGTSINGRDIYRVATVGDLIRAINYAAGNDGQVVAAISADGKHIELNASEGNVTIRSGVDSTGVISQAARDLGIDGADFPIDEPLRTRRLIGGLNTVMLQTLNGGAGAMAGVVEFTRGIDQTTSVDFSSARTLQDVVDIINAQESLGLTASINAVGNGITITGALGEAEPLTIADASGALAAGLKIAGTYDPGMLTVGSGNLQRQYVSRQTALSDLIGGGALGSGVIQINSTTGAVHRVNVGANIRTVGELIDAINLVTPDNLLARVNDRGDGIVVEDSGGGGTPLSIGDAQGQVAASLRLSGTAVTGTNYVDGSFEASVSLGAGDSLSVLAQKINDANVGASASVVNDGAAVNPFSLTLTSTVAGRRGSLLVDAGALDLGVSTLTEAQDALVSLGAGGGASSILVASRSNTLENVLPGVSINLLSTSNEDVTVTTTQDVDAIVESVRSFVDAYNELQSKIDEQTSFDSETLVRGTLFSDPTVEQIRRRLQRVMARAFDDVDPAMSRLFSAGLRLGAENRLEFDEQRFRDSYEQQPQQVEALFMTEDTGFGAVIQGVLDELTRDFDGVLARRDNALTDQQELLNDRISQMNVLLAAKRRRLEAQFAALEVNLAALQDQQSSLAALTQLAASAQV